MTPWLLLVIRRKPVTPQTMSDKQNLDTQPIMSANAQLAKLLENDDEENDAGGDGERLETRWRGQGAITSKQLLELKDALKKGTRLRSSSRQCETVCFDW